ncbi:elongation factor P 5-aminopentanone reductase [Clostridium tyrobutyricum]|uniref:elongation factor P 5-aminopentanone reductase n=1 Tax=Clostridium tyrobutyricum TaxID=1519 RepID=UPI001C38BA91|nr:SDR family oxidoreductase [Clostridium tyrobutyricum]MBV4441533.1 SDR family oxidoreductase [Clostridium tyrobutyricum]
MVDLSGKVAVVTGGSGDIGRAISIELAKCGANIIVNYRKNEIEARRTLDNIKKYGVTGIIFQGDVSNYNSAKKLIDCAVDNMGKIDILVNNAGVSNIGLFIDADEDQWNRIIDVDLKGVLNCTHCALKYMISKKNGIIVNISSIWGSEGASCESIYSAAKGAVNSFTKAIAKEMAPSNIRVNAVAPGVIDTKMNKWLSNDERNALIDEIPSGRFGKAEDISNIVSFLCSESSRYITGQIITVDGGMF